MLSNTQKRLFKELADKNLFQEVQVYAQDYLRKALERHVFPTAEAIENLRYFDKPLADTPTAAQTVLTELQVYGAPATVSIIGGRYFGFVNGSAVPAGLAAKQLATVWDQNTAMYVLSPIVSKLESVVESWLKDLFNLPKQTVAGFVSGSSMANFCALAAARYRLFERQGWNINENGYIGAPQIRVVAGEHVHSTVIKSLALLGIGKKQIEWIPVDEQGRIKTELIPALDNKTLLILQAGNVNSGAFDDFENLCELAQQAGAWVHIDGAFGLWAQAVPELQHLTKGMEKANSWAVDGHKTLNTPYDSGIVLCNDSNALASALHLSGSYIILSKDRDGMFFTPEMSRRGRAIELWATMKSLGRVGIAEMVYGMHQRAVQFAQEVNKIEGFYVLNDVVFNQVMVQCDTDELTNLVIGYIQQLRTCWIGGANWEGRRIIRVSVCAWTTTEQDISESVASFKKALEMATRNLMTIDKHQ